MRLCLPALVVLTVITNTCYAVPARFWAVAYKCENGQCVKSDYYANAVAVLQRENLDTFFLTNKHCIENAREIYVVNNARKAYKAEVVAQHPTADLILLRARWPYAIQPQPVAQNLSFKGVVWRFREGTADKVDTVPCWVNNDQITSQIPIIPGDSGSGVYTEDGHLMGIISLSDLRGTAFCVPLREIQELLTSYFKQKGPVEEIPPPHPEVTEAPISKPLASTEAVKPAEAPISEPVTSTPITSSPSQPETSFLSVAYKTATAVVTAVNPAAGTAMGVAGLVGGWFLSRRRKPSGGAATQPAFHTYQPEPEPTGPKLRDEYSFITAARKARDRYRDSG